uniref:Elongation factor 1-gamma n=1 Tax=Phaeocystis cordata TaxID=118079 RepID=A0A7S1MZB5_9EUKA
MTLTLFSFNGDKNAYKALVAAKYNGVDIELAKNFELGVSNKKPEFLKMSPTGKVPVLKTADGAIFESNAIARYVARITDKGLYGTTALDLGSIEQWIDFCTNEIDAPLLSWVLPLQGVWPYNKAKEDAAKEALKKALTVLNEHLKKNTFLVADRITLADIICVCNLYEGMKSVFDAAFRKPYSCVERYFVTCVNQPEFKAVIGSFELCKAPIKLQKQAKKEQPKKQEKKKKEQPAKAAAPPKEKKPKNPLDELPPSKMMMDAWKRLYSCAPANDFRNVACKRFWEGGAVPKSVNNEQFAGYDPEGFSLWFCDYKYNEENTVNFMVMNKVGGFLQRMEPHRKYCFGVMCILQKDNLFPITGVWLFRGQEIPPNVLAECGDIELYNWTKVDHTDEKVKTRIEDMFCQTDYIDGIDHIDCKVFK